MTQAPFSDLFLRKVKAPASGRVEFYDGRTPGFGVRVSARGTKTFFLLGRHRSGFRRITLGRYPTLSLEKARRRANDALNALSDGIDPQQEKRSARIKLDDQFKAVMAAYVETYCKRHNRPNTANETERLLNAVFMPKWSMRKINEIGKADVLTVIDAIMAEGKPSAARHAFAAIRKFFNWCVEQGRLDQSPCLALKPPAKASNRDRVLSDLELGAVLNAAKSVGWPFGPIVQLLACTAQRRGEVVGMQWNELDLEARLWTIPSDRTKNHRTHIVPLTASALAVIKNLPRVGDGPFVFPARRYSDRAYSGYSKGKRALDAHAEQHDWTLHDLRRTAATGMAKAGVAPHVVEKILNHVSGTFGGVAGVYNRFGYLDEMREALTMWEAHVDGLMKKSAK
ncbi:MAG: integrase [Hyphomicrobium sp.]|jgi:integrase|nr:MAG: integrase [Hyphomicrobium sp.]PPD00087.1 MAG: integrase [Hyphomicrobium sp.]